MSINYNNIDDLINLMYEFVYLKDKNTLDKYYFEKLEPSNIDIYDLIKKDFDYKIIFDKSFNNKNNFKIMNIIECNFNNLNYKKIILKKYFKNNPVTLVIQKYFNNNITETINDIKYELFMNQIISKFVIIDNIPFFLLNICNFDIKIDKIKEFDSYNDIINKQFYNNKSPPKECNDLFNISLYEHYQSYISMEDLFKENLSKDDITKIIFQVIYVYSFLFNNFSNFKHGAFDIKSFLIVKEAVPRTINVKLDNVLFKIENCNFTCKLFNYRFSNISSLPNNSVNYINLIDPSYEIYFFLKSLYDFSNKHNKENFNIILSIISNIIKIDNDLFDKALIDEESFYNIYYISIIPSQILLKNKIFTNFINMEYKEILKSDNFNSEFIGYRDLTSSNIKILTGGAKSKQKKISNSSSKMTSSHNTKKISNSKKGMSKQSKKNTKLRRTTDSDLDDDEDDEITMSLNDEIEKNKKNKSYEDNIENDPENDDEDDDNEKVDESDDSDSDVDNNLITVEEEEQNNFISEGDDDKNKTPFTQKEGGNINYKKMYEQMLNENKKLKSKSKSSSSSLNKKSLSKKQNKHLDSDSTTININDDNENGIKNIKNLQNQNTFTSALDSLGTMNGHQPNMNLNKQSIAQKPTHALDSLSRMEGMPSFSDVQIPNAESGISSAPMFSQANLKMGSNTDINSVFSQLNENSLIPVIPEMQHHFADSSFMQQQGMMPMMQPSVMGGKPEIIDKGLMGQHANANSGGLPMYDSEVSRIAGMQGFNSSMMGGGKNNKIINSNYQDEINSLILNEFNSKLALLDIQLGGSNGSYLNDKKKKNFFLTKNQIVPRLYF
jgi:hypothetical protein